MKKTFFACLLIATLLLIFPAYAQDVKIFLTERDLVGYSGESVETEIKIYNYQTKTDTFTITVWPPYWAGISATLEKSTAKIPANSSEAVKLYFSIPLITEEMILNFNITVKSLTDESISDSQSLSLRVIRKIPIYISDIKLNKYVLNPLETLKIEVSITNLDTKSYSVSLQTNLKKDESIVQRFDNIVEIPARSTQKVENSFVFERYAEPGNYEIEAMLKDELNRVVSEKETSLKLNAVYNITHNKSISYSLLFQTITIKVKNEGNSPTTTFYVTEDVPSFMKPFMQPTGHYTIEAVHDRIFYHWFVPSLMPGEERIVKYQINLLNVWALSLAIIALIGFGFRYVFTPKIVKRFAHVGPITRDKEIVISLDVRNRSRKEIKDVEVKDFVPSILGVVGKYDTLKAGLKRVRGGTEVIWKFDSLKPREERVLTYRIKPAVDVMGSLKLPKAKISYIDKKKVKKIKTSKSVIIKPK